MGKKKEFTESLFRLKIIKLKESLDNGWSISVARSHADISDKEHRVYFYTYPEYKEIVISSYKKHKNGTAHFKL